MRGIKINTKTIKYTFSALLIIVGIIMLLGIMGVKTPFFLSNIDIMLSGISGSIKFILPVIFIYLGIIILLRNKKLHILIFLNALVLYLLFLSIINLLTNIRLSSTNEVMTLFELIKRSSNTDNTINSKIEFSRAFKFMYDLSSSRAYYSQAGGALGLLISVPLYNLIGYIGSAILVCIIFIIVIAIFIKFIIVDQIINKNKVYRVGPYEFTNKNEYLQYLEYLENWRKQNNINPSYNNVDIDNTNSSIEFTQQEMKIDSEFSHKESDFSNQSLVYLPEETESKKSRTIPKGRKKKKTENSLNISSFADLKNDEQIISDEDINSQMRLEKDRKIRDKNEKVKDQLENNPFELEKNIESLPVNNTFLQKSLFGEIETGKRFDNTTPNLELLNNNQNVEEKEIIKKEYVYPKAALLENPFSLKEDFTIEDQNNSKIIEETLESFKIPSKVVRICRGPAVTRFEVDIASGIKVNKVVSSAENLALKLSSQNGVRIEAPVPGTTYIGIEIPNKRISPISFKEVLFSKEMQEITDPLAIALGKDIAGKPIICNLEKMPHLLIAGATGSGKSVCINSIIMSLIYRCSPDECRLILIDPKFVELSRYNVLPHLLVPVVNETSKASGALSWAVAEMNDRYNLFKNYRVNNIKEYNKLVSDTGKKLPRIVIIIDEMADLMVSTSKKEVEYNVNRLAALARAAGLHLVVATQRPSVNVITGVIKSNLPSRIAFAASSAVDSRTILDRQGAENLLGNGDMLYLPIGSMNPIRVQGCFVKNNEVNTVIEFIRKNNSTNFDESATEAVEMAYNSDIQEPIDNIKAVDSTDNNVDALLEEAIDMVLSDGQASISMLQRRLSIGYARAGRLVDTMAKYGIVSQASGSKAREVLMTREQFEEIRYKIL